MSFKTYLVLVCFIATCAESFSGGPIPAVDLPTVVPDAVRERVARELASTRDTLGWTIRSFRGEFHGLGNPGGGSSQAFDLSANGRVVVGADRGDSGGSRAFVWSPWTGRAHYDMGPGDTVATAISADGVYVAGNAGNHAFRWSLAGKELIPAPAEGLRTAAALSGNGKRLVGVQQNQLPPAYEAFPITFESEIDLVQAPLDTGTSNSLTIIPWRTSQAYQYSRANGPAPYAPVEGYEQTEAVDISADGSSVLGNASVWPFVINFGGGYQTTEPVVWRNNQSVLLGGLYDLDFVFADDLPGSGLSDLVIFPINRVTQSTTAAAISADGSTVVGENIFSRFPTVITAVWPPAQFFPNRQAVMWREATGWIDLGDAKVDSAQVHRGDAATDVSADGSLVIGHTLFQEQPLVQIFGSGATLSYEYTPVEQTPFLWDEARGMRDLTDVLQFDYGLDLGDWDLGDATAISDDGTTIIGNGVNPDGVGEAWRAVLHRETPHGDIDFDGDVDRHDYATLMANLGLDSDASAVFYADGDLNGDGLVDEADSMAMLGLYEHRDRGDFNADGLVDLADYTVWRDHAGRFTGGLADSNGDGWVNDLDLVAWRRHFGEAIASLVPYAVPEPRGVVGLLLAVAAVGVRRPR